MQLLSTIVSKLLPLSLFELYIQIQPNIMLTRIIVMCKVCKISGIPQ